MPAPAPLCRAAGWPAAAAAAVACAGCQLTSRLPLCCCRRAVQCVHRALRHLAGRHQHGRHRGKGGGALLRVRAAAVSRLGCASVALGLIRLRPPRKRCAAAAAGAHHLAPRAGSRAANPASSPPPAPTYRCRLPSVQGGHALFLRGCRPAGGPGGRRRRRKLCERGRGRRRGRRRQEEGCAARGDAEGSGWCWWGGCGDWGCSAGWRQPCASIVSVHQQAACLLVRLQVAPRGLAPRRRRASALPPPSPRAA